MVQTWISLVSTGVASFITGFCAWFFTRKQYEENVNAQRVQNFDATIDAYKKMYEDMVNDLKEQVADLKNENNTLKDELSENRKQIITLTNFVLASAMQRADGNMSPEIANSLKKIME